VDHRRSIAPGRTGPAALIITTLALFGLGAVLLMRRRRAEP
jgi:hypothetical protein